MKTLGDYRQQHAAHLTKVRGYAISTSQAYDNDLARFISWLRSEGTELPQAVDTRTIEQYLGQLACGSTTKARIRSSLSSYFTCLTNWGVIKVNPCSQLQPIKVRSKEPSYLTLEQCNALLSAVSQTTPYYKARDTALISLMLKAGVRRQEAERMDIEDVNLEQGTILLSRKGGGQQTVPLHPVLAAELEAYLGTLPRTNGALFLSKRGNRLSAAEIWHLVKKYAHEAGLSDRISPHSLRHSFCSVLLSNNVQLSYISKLMGHKSITSTARYLHFQNSQVRTALEMVTF